MLFEKDTVSILNMTRSEYNNCYIYIYTEFYGLALSSGDGGNQAERVQSRERKRGKHTNVNLKM